MKFLRPCQVSELVRNAIGNGFLAYGSVCVKYPWLPIIVSIAFALASGFGMFLLETESSGLILFNQNDMESFKNWEFIEETFEGTVAGTNVYLITKGTEDVISLALMREAFELHKFIVGDIPEFRKWCLRTNTSRPCRSSDVFGFLGITTEAELEARINDGSVARTLAQFEHLSKKGGKQCLRFFYVYESKGDVDKFMEWRNRWERDALDSVLTVKPKRFESYAILNEAVSMAETEKVTVIPLMIASSCLIICAVTMMISGKPCLRSRFALGSVVIVSVLLSMLSAFGLAGIFGIKWNPITVLLFFILLAIGVDDMIVIIHHTDVEEGTYAERIPRGLQKSGLAITLTSLTSMCAFASATQVPMAIISDFCAVGIFGILTDYLMQLTFFVGVFVYDERRREQSRLDCLCCVKKGQDAAGENAAGEEAFIPESSCGAFEKLMRILSKTLMHPAGIFIYFILWVVLVSFPAWQLSKVTTEFDLKSYFSSESPFHLGLLAQETYFEGHQSTMLIYIDHRSSEQRFLNVHELAALDDTYASLTALDWVTPPNAGRDVSDWTFAFRRWLNHSSWPDGAAPGAGMVDRPFEEQLAEFLDAHQFSGNLGMACPPWCVEPGEFQRDLILGSGFPIWSRVRMSTTWSESSAARTLQWKEALRIVDAKLSPVNGFVHDGFFIDQERDERIIMDVFKSLSITCAVVAAEVMLVLDPFIGILVGICIALIGVSVLGTLTATGNPLTVVAYLNLSMVMGMCVDYVVHSVHAMLHEFNKGKTAAATLEDSFAKIGISIFEGALSSIMGLLLPAFFGNSQAARNFGQTMCLAILFGAAYGLVWAPIVMYLGMRLIRRTEFKVHPQDVQSNDKMIGVVPRKCEENEHSDDALWEVADFKEE